MNRGQPGKSAPEVTRSPVWKNCAHHLTSSLTQRYSFLFLRRILLKALVCLWLQWGWEYRRTCSSGEYIQGEELCWNGLSSYRQLQLWIYGKDNEMKWERQKWKATCLFTLKVCIRLHYHWLHTWRNSGVLRVFWKHSLLAFTIRISFVEVAVEKVFHGLEPSRNLLHQLTLDVCLQNPFCSLILNRT